MTTRVYAAGIHRHLTAAGHTSAVHRTTWTPGHRAVQASPYTVRVWHDGPDEATFLAQYAAVLAGLGYHVTHENAAEADLSSTDRRPSIKATLPSGREASQ